MQRRAVSLEPLSAESWYAYAQLLRTTDPDQGQKAEDIANALAGTGAKASEHSFMEEYP